MEAVALQAGGQTDDDKERRKNQELATKWLKEISRRRGGESRWREKARKVVDRYRDDRDATEDTRVKFNILWANTEVLKPAIFVRMPVADVRRRYMSRDPVARTGALILERALTYSMDSYDFKDTLERALEDYLLPGRGQAVVCYKPYFREERKTVEPLPNSDEKRSEEAEGEPALAMAQGATPDATQEPASDAQAVPPVAPRYPEGTLFDDAATLGGPHQMQQEKLYEEVYCEYQEWDYYVFGEAKQRCKVPWEAYGERLTKDEVKEAYPDFDTDLLTFSVEKDEEADTEAEKTPPKVTRWKVWHKASRKVLVFLEGYREAPIEVMDDPLQLEGFYPAPDPLYAMRTNGNDMPKPEFLMYQDQAIELDVLVDRQRSLTQALKYRGIYDKILDTEESKFGDLARAPDNTFLPVPNFRQLAEKGGIESLIDTLPLEDIAQVLAWLTGRIELLKQEIYEVYGISDIVRGASKASETLGAQQLKAQYAGMRISTRQQRFQRFVRDILRIKAEIIAEHFSPETLKIMTGIEVIPDAQFEQLKSQQALQAGAVSESEFMGACQLIKSDKLRGFRIDIETDSTSPVDRDAEQQNRIAFMGAVGTYLQGMLPAVESGAIPIKLAREGLLFVVRGFKVGTELEEVLDELGENSDEAEQMQQLKQQLVQVQQQLAQLQTENQKLKSDAAVKMQSAQVDSQIRAAEAGQDMQLNQAQAQAQTQSDIANDRLRTVADISNQRMKANAAPRQSA